MKMDMNKITLLILIVIVVIFNLANKGCNREAPVTPTPTATSTSTSTTMSEPFPELAKDLVIDFGGGIKINFRLCEAGDLILVKRLDGKSKTQTSMDTPFYIMETELTIGMYNKLKELSPELPELAEFNKNCNEKNREDDKDKPLHGIIPFEERNTDDALIYARQICKAMNKAYEKYGEAGKPIDKLQGFRIPTDKEWQYACRATADASEGTKYVYFGKLQGRNLDSGDNWHEILDHSQKTLARKGSDGMENKYKSYMSKYWYDIWNRDFMRQTGEVFEGKPEQLIMIYLNKDSVCKKPIPREKIEEIVDSIPQTLLFYYLYDTPRCKAHQFLYSTAFCPVKKTEIPNVWGLYDMHSNASEIVLRNDYDDGSYGLKGGSFNTTLPNEWMRFSIGYTQDISDFDMERFKHAMPGLRLVISAAAE